MDFSKQATTAAAPHTSLEDSQACVAARLAHADELLEEENLSAAKTELETALAEARAAPYEIKLQTRAQLALTLAELYLADDEIEKACQMLAEESSFAETTFQLIQATGTPAQKRNVAGYRTQVSDVATQIGLIGHAAPEISVKEWMNGPPVALADLRGRVVLLDFWATWCKPCNQTFPKLKNLHDKYGARDLVILALTRHYMAYGGAADSQKEELELIRAFANKHEVEFRVGVSEDERTQDRYGATGLPTLALVDRAGAVRYTYGSIEDAKFKEVLNRCLDAQT